MITALGVKRMISAGATALGAGSTGVYYANRKRGQ